MKAKIKIETHNFGKHNDARKMLMVYHSISSRSAAKALKYINSFK
jgi:hypothetical protein